MASASPHPKKANAESKKPKKTASDSESDSDEPVKPATPTLEKSSTTILKEIKATFDFKGPKDFQKIRILGKGGVGRVYLVQLKGTDKLFAMKVLKQEEMISRNKVKRVLTEREVLATTKHPLIISLYYSFQSRSRLYFVMDYCAGGEFYRVIQMQPNKCLTEEQMRFYAAEVLLALEYLHAMGFVYRDLKPENILLHASGHIRLTDFDLSKASVTPVNAHVVQSMMGTGPTLVAEPSLVTNSFVGTEEYLAPEVIVGKGYGASVDWWTFGILMYEMLYGATPFRGKSQGDTFHRIEKSVLKFPDHPRGPVSKECKNLIKKLLTHDPKKRLGYEQGAAEIKSHPFFKDVNLQLILNSKPPIIPELTGPKDFKYFSSKMMDDDKDDEDMEFVNPDELDADHPFKAFAAIDRDSDAKMKAPTASSSAHKAFKKSSSHAGAASPSSPSSSTSPKPKKDKHSGATLSPSSSSASLEPAADKSKSGKSSRRTSREDPSTTSTAKSSSGIVVTTSSKATSDKGASNKSGGASGKSSRKATTDTKSSSANPNSPPDSHPHSSSSSNSQSPATSPTASDGSEEEGDSHHHHHHHHTRDATGGRVSKSQHHHHHHQDSSSGSDGEEEYDSTSEEDHASSSEDHDDETYGHQHKVRRHHDSSDEEGEEGHDKPHKTHSGKSNKSASATLLPAMASSKDSPKNGGSSASASSGGGGKKSPSPTAKSMQAAAAADEEVEMPVAQPLKLGGKVARSKTPHPTEDDGAATPTSPHPPISSPKPHKSKHPAPPEDDDDDLPTTAATATSKSKSSKSSTPKSKRSTTPEPTTEDTASNSSSKSMKKVPSNLSEEMDKLSIASSKKDKSSSKSSKAPSSKSSRPPADDD